jgi:predicted CXXCH cytochrome family protein
LLLAATLISTGAGPFGVGLGSAQEHGVGPSGSASKNEGQRRSGDLRSTKHNMAGQNSSAEADPRAVCIYCHTPTIVESAPEDGAAARVIAPLWYPSLISDGVPYEFGIYDDIGRGQGIGSQSMACLSCHDSSQAFGIGDYDHPIGIPYRGALSYPARKAAAETPSEGVVRRAARAQVEDADFKPARQSVINNREVWWVPTSDSSVARTRQDIPLYVRPQLDQLDNGVPFLECSSCHDPHSNNRLFLRVVNQQSRLCAACHEK